ncbi:MAG: hypothetical protein AVDCRST_MAG45-2524, partial [uncultured Solirubrobacterales bacterium]
DCGDYGGQGPSCPRSPGARHPRRPLLRALPAGGHPERRHPHPPRRRLGQGESLRLRSHRPRPGPSRPRLRRARARSLDRWVRGHRLWRCTLHARPAARARPRGRDPRFEHGRLLCAPRRRHGAQDRRGGGDLPRSGGHAPAHAALGRGGARVPLRPRRARAVALVAQRLRGGAAAAERHRSPPHARSGRRAGAVDGVGGAARARGGTAQAAAHRPRRPPSLRPARPGAAGGVAAVRGASRGATGAV